MVTGELSAEDIGMLVRATYGCLKASKGFLMTATEAVRLKRYHVEIIQALNSLWSIELLRMTIFTVPAAKAVQTKKKCLIFSWRSRSLLLGRMVS